MSERLDFARRLELSDLSESGDVVEGTFRGVALSLEDHGLERTLRLDVKRLVRWISVKLHVGDVNDPDVVQTEDRAFDDAVQVLAQDGYEPQVRAVFDSAPLRTAVETFFKRYPNATIHGTKLTMPHVPMDKADTQEAIDQSTKLVLALRAALDHTPDVDREAPPVLQHTVTEPVAESEAQPDPLLPLPENPARPFIYAAGAFALLAYVFFKPIWIPVALMGVALSALLWWMRGRN